MKHKSTSGEGQRPILKLRLFEKLGILVVVNIIPIVICVTLLGKWLREEIVITDVDGLRAALILLVASAIYVFCSWMLMPTAKWFKEYTIWQFRHGISLVWSLPLALAYIMWIITWIFCALAGLAIVAAAVGVVVYVIRTVNRP